MAGEYKEYTYNNVGDTWATHYVLPAVQSLLGPSPKTVLDLGCGNGTLARKLLAMGFDVYGVDASKSGVFHANTVAPGRFFVLDVDSHELPIELAGNRFDAVISTEVIEHLYAPRSLLRLARRALKDDGTLILSTPYHGYLKNLALAISGRLDAHFTVLWDGGHIKFFSFSTLKQLLADEGFEVTGFEGAGRLPYLWKSMVVRACPRV